MNYNRDDRTITVKQATGVYTSIGFLITLGIALFFSSQCLTTIQNRVDSAVTSIKENREEINKLKTSDTSNQIKFTEIQTQLKGIGVTQEELKTQNGEILKELRSRN